MKKIKLAVIGGFLGSGKTTLILNLAKQLMAQKIKVGIVTNDQGSNLVDTAFLVANGLPVMDVEGGCFCCNFGEFTRKINAMAKEQMPDIILAEPVGSCTDLIATIFRPFQIKYSNDFDLSPLVVLADPKRAARLLLQEETSLFPNEINYLFQKQLEEADIILLNKCDLYEESEIIRIKSYLENKYKGAVVETGSALHNVNVSKLLPVLLGETQQMKPLMDVDYEIYGLAEQFLGWLNARASLGNPGHNSVQDFLCDFMNNARCDIIKNKGEIAHLKSYCVASGGYIKASITSWDDEISVYADNPANAETNSLIINARVGMDPVLLEQIIYGSIKGACEKYKLVLSDYKVDSFVPGKPCKCARENAYTVS
ncbi:MAG: GTP-binding protein [Christensenellales bacterium]